VTIPHIPEIVLWAANAFESAGFSTGSRSRRARNHDPDAEDVVSIDQVVLSAEKYLTSPAQAGDRM
jgi:hypothetical protein